MNIYNQQLKSRRYYY